MTDRQNPDSPPRRPMHWRERRRRTVGWGSSDILRAAALIILLYLLLKLIWVANALIFVVFLGILFGLAVSSAVDRLEELRIPRGIGAGLTVLGFFALLAGSGVILAPTLREQATELRQRLPEAIERIEGWIESSRDGALGFLVSGLVPEESPDESPAGEPDAGEEAGDTADTAEAGGDPTEEDTAAADTGEVSSGGAAAPAPGSPGAPGLAEARASAETTLATDAAPVAAEARRDPTQAGDDETQAPGEEPAISLRERLGDQLGGVARYFFSVLSSTIAVITGIVLMIFLAIFIAADPDLYHRGLLHLFPHHVRPRIGEVLSATAAMLRRWLLTQLIGMAVIGVVTTIVLAMLGVEAAIALGLLAGLLEFVPTIGPLLSAVPAIAMGFLDSPQTALYVAIAYVVIQFLESNLLMPMLVQEGVDIPPALSIVFQALMALLFGFLGLLVAVPLLAGAMMPIKMLYVEDVVGDQVVVPEDDDEDAAEDDRERDPDD